MSYGWRWKAGRRRGGACVPGASFERCRGCTHYEPRGLARHTRDKGGSVRTVAGSAQGPGVSCDVLFSAKSCICAHGGENVASTAVCTRALRCGAFLISWWWCWCWCLWWSKVFVLMLPPPKLVAAAGDDA